MASGLSSSEEPPSNAAAAAPSLEERPSEARAPAHREKWLGLEGESEDHEKVSDSKTAPVQRPGHECGMPRHHFESSPYKLSHGKYPRRGSPPPHQHYSHFPPLQSRSPGRTPSPRLKQCEPLKNTCSESKGRRIEEPCPKSPPTTPPYPPIIAKALQTRKISSAPHPPPSKPYSRSKIPSYNFSGWKYLHRGSPPSPPHQHYSHSTPQQSRLPSRRHLQHQSHSLSSPHHSPIHRIEMSRSSESGKSPRCGGEDRERFKSKQHAERPGYSKTPSTRSKYYCEPLKYDNPQLNHHRIKQPCPKSPSTTLPPPKPEPKPPKQEKTLSTPQRPPSKPHPPSESPSYEIPCGKYTQRGSPPSPPHQHYSHSPPLQSRFPGRTPSPRLKQCEPLNNTRPEPQGRRIEEFHPKSPPTTPPYPQSEPKLSKLEKSPSAPHSPPSKPFSQSKIPTYNFSGGKYLHRGSSPSPPHQHYSHSTPQQSRLPSRRHLQHQSPSPSSPHHSPVHRIQMSRSSESGRSPRGEDRERFQPKQHTERAGYSRTPSPRSTHRDPLKYDNPELNRHRMKGPCPKSPPTPSPPKPEPKPLKQEKVPSTLHQFPSKPYPPSESPSHEIPCGTFPRRESPPSPSHQHYSHFPPPQARSPGHRHLRHRSPSPSPPRLSPVRRTQRSRSSESGRSSPRYGGEDRERFEPKQHPKRPGYSRTPSPHSKHHEPLECDNPASKQHRIEQPCPKSPLTTPPPPKPEKVPSKQHRIKEPRPKSPPTTPPPKPKKALSAPHQPPSLEELLSDVPKEKLNQQCRNEDLVVLSHSITDWQVIAPYLGLTEAEEQAIKEDWTSAERRRIAMLRKWKGKFGNKATYKKLAEAFNKYEHTGLVEKLCELLQESRDNSSKSGQDSTAVTPQVHVHLPVATCEQKQKRTSYATYLQGVYKTDNPGFLILQWPPPPTHKVFNLAMILQESMRCGPIDEEFVRLTLRGNVDDIMYRKTAVKVEDIFKLDTLKHKRISDRKLILIEGAPGAGKSTLAWHIPQKWARGELFQEFEVVVFIQLRDPEVQAALSLADLLPARNKATAEMMASELCASDGQNVLFVLDSWDEFSPQLKQGSIFQQLICNPKMLSLHLSTVLITSRPIASGVLYPYVSSRVEIVGFTPTEREHYFTEVLRGDSEKVQKLQEHLSTRPMIEASCYLPLNAAIVAHLFLTLNQTLPTTHHGVFTSLVICCLIRHMQREGREEELDIPDTPSFEDLPVDIQQPFKNICTLAYHGIMKNKVTFSASDLQSFNLPTKLSTLSLIQAVESFTTFKKAETYNFLHLSIQELLAAFYIAKLSESEQVRIFKELSGEPRFAAVFQYYAAFSKLQAKGVRDVVANIVKSEQQKDRSDMGCRSKPLLLSLLHCLYEAQDLSLCQFVASQLNGELNLFGNSLSPVDCLAVGYFLRSVCLTTSGEFKAYLAYFSLDHYRVSFLVRELSKCSSSSDAQSMAATDDGAPGCLDLDLSSNINGRGVKCIAELLSRCSLIGKLKLKRCEKLQKGEDGLYYLLQALKVNTSLRYLSLWGCSLNITEDNGPILTEMLQTNKTLKLLELSSNNISDMGAFCLAEGLSHNTGLKKLSVSNCAVTGKGAIFLSRALIVNRSLIILDIGKNGLGDDGIAYISHSLTINTTLRELLLDMCDLTDKGAELLARMLTVNKGLEALQLWWNAITDTGATHIATALRHNLNLKKLFVSKCGIGDPGITSLATTLTVNSTLEELDLSHNQFTDTGLMALGDSLKNNRGFQRLVLWYISQVTAEGLRQFVLCLEENCHFIELVVCGTAGEAKTVWHETELVNETRRQRGLPELVVTDQIYFTSPTVV